MTLTSLFLCIGIILFPLLSSAARAADNPIIVTALHVSQPGILGRFATADCTIRNTSRTAIPVKGVEVTAGGPDAKEELFDVSPPNPPLPNQFQPGQEYSFRTFRKMTVPGDFTCTVKVQDQQQQWIPLPFADGRLATANLQVVAADAVPQARFRVTDPAPTHVYHTGDTIQVQVLPILTGGTDITGEIADMKISTPTKPFSITDPARAMDLLVEPKAKREKDFGFQVDFWGVADSQKYVDITFELKHPVELSSLSLTGFNLNGYYSLKSCLLDVVSPNGITTSVPVLTTLDGSRWTAYSILSQSVTTASLRLRLTTPYKINVTRLTLQGSTAAGQKTTAAADISEQWIDESGRLLAPGGKLTPFMQNSVSSPERLQPGYYGLALTTRIPGIDDARTEYGFVVLPPRTVTAPEAERDPRLGMVHASLEDSNLGYAWVKTLATNFYDGAKETLDAAGWKSAIAYRSARGLSEAVVVMDAQWASDSTKPVSQEALRRLNKEMLQHFKAAPEVRYWELGLEENLGYRGRAGRFPFYWPNLEAKAKAVRDAATEAGADVKLIYQVAEIDPQSVEDFCKSSASKLFDILSLHPYAWPDFPPPEKWLPAYMEKVYASMKRYDAVKPIWFTEIGAPHNGNPGGFFGYPNNPAYDRGLSRSRHADYMVQCHLMAFRLGVEKVFWYNYQDSGFDPEYAERHFGMVDFRGYPKACYAAYCTMARMIRDRKFASFNVIGSDLQVYRFSGLNSDVIAAWTYPARQRTVSLAALGIHPAAVTEVVDVTGRPVPISIGALLMSKIPVYVVVRR